jgi:hypothetical protein
MDDGSPSLEVGFLIDASGSLEQLVQLQSVMDSTEGKIVKDAANIERATSGMINLAGATASVAAFGTAADRASQQAARSFAQVERSGESLVKSLERQASTFGKTSSEVRQLKAETAALAAEQQGLTELAQRIRTAEAAIYDQEYAAIRKAAQAAEAAAQDKAAAAAVASAAAESEAQALRSAALAYQMFQARAREAMTAFRAEEAAKAAAALKAEADAAARAGAEHALLAAAVRGSHDASVSDAAAAEKLRMSTDPLYAAVKRLNDELAESTRLYHAGFTPKAEYTRQQEVLTQRLKATTEQHEASAIAGGRNAQSLQMMAVQLPDVVQGLLSGQKPMTVFIQQGGQLVQIAMMAEGGLKGMVRQLAILAAMAAPILISVGVVAGGAFIAFRKFQESVKDSGELTRYRDSLGLTHKEMLELSDGVDKAGGKIDELTKVTVTAGDTMSGLWKAITDKAGGTGANSTWDSIKKGASSAFDWVLEAWMKTAAGITAGIDGTFTAVKVIWGKFPEIFGELFINGVNNAISALNKLVKAGVDQLNGYIAMVNLIPGVKIGAISAPEIKPIDNPFAGTGAKVAKDISKGYSDAYTNARKEDAKFWAQVRANALQSAKDRMKAEADALKANRTPHPPKVDHNALNAEAVESQITNLYKLADAYKISGAAALIAEAREKAESQAIKARADVEAAVDRQIRLSIATRVADAAKSTAATRDQADAQERANALVERGILPASKAAEYVKNQIADLPLLAAIQAAQQRGLAVEADRATKALDDQRKARLDLFHAEEQARFDASQQASSNQVALLEAQLRLVGETDAVRSHTLAVIKATADAEAQFTEPAKRAAFIADQVKIADLTQQISDATTDYNDALSFTADKWSLIGQTMQEAASGLADAFGAGGQALGDITQRFTAYAELRARADLAHQQAVDRITKSTLAGDAKTAALARENTKFALQSATSQIDMFGDMAQAAKGFFGEGTKGYKAMADAEKVFRAIQFALSVKAMAQDAIETASSIAKSVLRAGKYAVEAVAKAIASLPFPANLVAGAATAAALAAIGIKIFGGFGGSKNNLEKPNEGTGTVLGDASAKSDSIKNSLEALKNVDTLTNVYSRQMLESLRSIDSQISGVTSQVLRAGNVNADSTVKTGFKSNAGTILAGVYGAFLGPVGAAIGALITKIPIIGGIIKSLFGTRTDIVGNGLSAGPQSVGSVLNGGFNAQYYSDIQKTHKFLGIVTGRSYSTNYTAADPALTNQFTLILKSFNDAIIAAAGPLGAATTDIQNRLNSFVVNIGKIDLKGLTGDQIEEKLNAIFGAAADDMANAAFPGITQFQKAGEGAFETLVRVSSTVEAVTTALDQLGTSAQNLGVGAKLGLADQFDSIGDFTSAVSGYFEAFYSKEEQAAAKTAQFSKVFASLGLAMPNTLAGFRALVEAQDLTTAAGQQTYATLLQLAPAFADLQNALNGAKSAADIASERSDLQRQLLELQGDKAALRALDLAKLDPSNRALQQQIYDLQDAQDAAKAAQDLADAWKSVGDSIMDEVRRIRGLTDTGSGGFASLLGQFNAATTAARAGDQDAAKSLPGLSQSLLTAAANVATSQQELRRIQAQTAASLEATYNAIAGMTGASTTASPATAPISALLAAVTATQAAATPSAANDDLADEISQLRAEVAGMRAENNAGHAATAGNTGRVARTLDNVTQATGGDAVATRAA